MIVVCALSFCQYSPNNITLTVLCLSSQEPLRGRSISWAWLTSSLSTTRRRKPLMQQKLSNTGWVTQERERGEGKRWRAAVRSLNVQSYLLSVSVTQTMSWPLCLSVAGWCWDLHSPPRAVRQKVSRLHLQHFCVTLRTLLTSRSNRELTVYFTIDQK